MRTDTAPSLPPGVYRPGADFSAAELQVMVHEGALRPLLGDLYAASSLPDAPALRALACRTLLAGGLRAHAVLCGESAAWVHLGTPAAPPRITVITAGVYRRRTAGPVPWQVHQVPLTEQEQRQLQGVPVTTPLRTAADLFLGLGTVGSRRALDAPPAQPDTRTATDAGSAPGTRSGPGPGRAPEAGSAPGDDRARRWSAIRRLCLSEAEPIHPQALLRQIQSQLGGRGVLQRGHGTTDTGHQDDPSLGRTPDDPSGGRAPNEHAPHGRTPNGRIERIAALLACHIPSG